MSRATIICVDDEAMVRDTLAEQLKRQFGLKYSIELAEDAQEAIELCEELNQEGTEIPLVISDQMMPGMMGADLLIHLHQNYPQSLKILLTGQAAAESVGRVVNAGALYRYIAKPWDEIDFLLTVQEALRSYEQNRELDIQLKALNKSRSDLQSYLSQLLTTLECTADGILVLNNAGEVVQFNQKLVEVWGLGQGSIPRHHDHPNLNYVFDRLRLEGLYPVREQAIETATNLHTLSLNNERVLECYWQPQRVQGKTVGQVWSFRDITERKKSEAFITYQATHDSLTGLPNRKLFDQKLAKILEEAETNETIIAVMFLDLDRFKLVNDTLGHAVGDQLLKAVVGRLKNCLRSNDFIARWGGDEFTLILPDASSREDIEAIAKRIHTVLNPNFQLNGHTLHIGSSVGIAVYPKDGRDSETLLKNADSALYNVKENGRNGHSFYSEKLREKSINRLSLENQIRCALDRGEFLLHYQPRVDALTGKIIHLEALIRWQHPQKGLVPPGKFIPFAEESGLIIPIGEWVLYSACAQAKVWNDMGFKELGVGVNLSASQFKDPSLSRYIRRAIGETGLQPNLLELEVTETTMMQDLGFAKSTLEQIKEMGLSVAMDDFGVGYASLRYLQQLPFDTLKIDQSFIQDLDVNPSDTFILEAILALGKGLGLNLVAEGVETEAAKNQLLQMSCQYMQGYLFSRPMPEPAITELLGPMCCST